MSLRWACDCCDEPGHIHPPVEHVHAEQEVEATVIEVAPEGEWPEEEKARQRFMASGKAVRRVTKRVKQRVPVMKTILRQNPHTGKMEEAQVPETRDLAPRTFIVSMTVGTEDVTIHLCKECLEEHRPAINALWDLLVKLKETH